MKPGQRIFVGVIAPINPRMETPDEVRDRVLQAARYIPAEQLGTTDDCGFSPFSDDKSTSRETAFEKIRVRVIGTALAAKAIGDSECIKPTTKKSNCCARWRYRTPTPSCSRASVPSRSWSGPRRRSS